MPQVNEISWFDKSILFMLIFFVFLLFIMNFLFMISTIFVTENFKKIKIFCLLV